MPPDIGFPLKIRPKVNFFNEIAKDLY